MSNHFGTRSRIPLLLSKETLIAESWNELRDKEIQEIIGKK
jgi:hypothetical protein